VSAYTIASIVAGQLGAKPIRESEIQIDPSLVSKIPPQVALEYELLPLRVFEGALEVVIAEPRNYFGLDDLRLQTGYKNITVFVASQIVIHNLLAKYYGQRPIA
jgi:type IV pilus assembly protein PilB